MLTAVSFQFHNSDDAKKALEQLNGFELAGRPMKVNHVTERSETQQGSSLLDSDEMERAGIDLGKSWFVTRITQNLYLELPAFLTIIETIIIILICLLIFLFVYCFLKGTFFYVFLFYIIYRILIGHGTS